MKTKYLFGAAAALMFAACSQDELVSVKQDAITYSVTAATQTRAADSYCNNALPGGFKVWAKTDDGKLYINGDRIKNEGRGVWTDEDGTRYWPDNNTLDFYAEVNGNDEFRFNDGTPTFENFTVRDKVEDQLDLIYSVHKNQGKPTDGKVTLNFRHALSQVCFRARNNMKNMQVEIKGVTVGHLAKTGTFAFPTESTDNNYEHHDDVADNTTTLNGGVWTIAEDALYNNTYSVTPIGGSVLLAADSKTVENLTCPGQGHENGFAQVLTLLPQTVEAWNPEVKGTDFNGAYFLVKVVLSNIVKNDEGADVATVVYKGQAAIPVNVAWKQGYRYIYTFIFDEGGDGGWTPDPNDPKPVLTSVKYDVTVDDFIPVDEDKKMDTGKEEEEPTETTYALTFNANGGHFGDVYHATEFATDSTLTATSKKTSYEFKVFETTYTLGTSKEGYDLIGWAWSKDATTAEYVYGDKVTLTKDEPDKTLYAVWKENTTVDHTKNPLLKWAEGNLERSGTGANVIGTIKSETSTGSYYQFGRNYGFNSANEASTNYGVECSDIDLYNYEVYAGDGTAAKTTAYYASRIDYKKYPEYFFIDINHNGDYTTPDHTDTWKERAAKMGYTKESPCPDGWRLPTSAEFKEIMPVIDDNAGNKGSNAWKTLIQLKTLADGTKCAFRWSKIFNNGYSYLKIECLVVNESMTDTSNINWDDENVETRIFKGSGYIAATRNYWQYTQYSIGSTIDYYYYTARPMEWGYYDASISYNNYNYTNSRVSLNLTKSCMTYGGFYWTSDADQATFTMIFDNSTGYTLGYYLSSYKQAIAANIRCVKAE